MLSYSSWGKGDFHPNCSVTQLHMLDWILEKEVSKISTVTANQLYAVVIQTVYVKLNPIGRKLECNRSVNVSSSHLFNDWYVNFISDHSRTQWTSGFNSHLWKSEITYSMFPWFWCAELFSSEQINLISIFLFFLNLVLCCSYQNLCWSSGLFFFFPSLQTIQNSYLQNVIYPRGLQRTVMWKASQIFSLVSVFLLFFLVGKGNSLLCTSISKAPVS